MRLGSHCLSPRCLLGFQGSGSELSEPVDDPDFSLRPVPGAADRLRQGGGSGSLNLKGYGNWRPTEAGRMAVSPE